MTKYQQVRKRIVLPMNNMKEKKIGPTDGSEVNGVLSHENQLEVSKLSFSQHIPFYKRQDVLAWFVGMLFGFAIIGAIFGAGHARGWYAPSGFQHNDTNTSRARFLPEPFIEEPGVHGRHGIDATARWYYWKLPPQKATPLTRLFMWLCYCSHQILIWIVIYISQISKVNEAGRMKYQTTVRWYSLLSLSLNAVFHLLHFANTHLTYDALAQDVSIASSQGSVIMLLVVILLMEYRDRGMFFGWPTMRSTSKVSQRLRLSYGPVNLFRKFHGYAFAWASIYTFWYHPMENTVGHALGFIYTWMIMLQGSLLYTKFHLNRYWRLFLEAFVVVHGGLVAYQTGGPAMKGTTLWPMFVFGFLMVLAITQVFGLQFWNRIPKFLRIIPLLIYTGITLGAYSWIPDKDGRPWVRLPTEIIRIPAIYYLAAFLSWLVLMLFLAIEKKCKSKLVKDQSRSLPVRIAYFIASLLLFVLCVVISVIVQVTDVQLYLFVLMIILVLVFLLATCISLMLMKQALPRKTAQTTSTVAIFTTTMENFGSTDAIPDKSGQ